jgi:hypothetical protein
MTNQKREEVILSQELLADLAHDNGKHKFTLNDIEYQEIETTITGTDYEDGGATYEVVFQRLSDGKYFKFSYNDWDLEYNFVSDFPNKATEVFPKTITKIIFE